MNFMPYSPSRSSYPSTISQESALSDIFSWSTSVEPKAQPPTSSIQAIPIDIRASLDFDNFSCIAPSTISTMIDSAKPDFEFDSSCLDGFDSQLLHFPLDAFAAMCWLGATGSVPTHLAIGNASSSKKFTHEELSPGSSSDESESDSDASPTRDDHVTAVLVDSNVTFAVGPVEPMMRKDLIIQLPLDDSMVSLEPHFTKSDPRDSIGYFPVPTSRRRTKSTGIASFLPTRFMKSSLVA